MQIQIDAKTHKHICEQTISQTELSAADGKGEKGGAREAERSPQRRLCIIEYALLPLAPNKSAARLA